MSKKTVLIHSNFCKAFTGFGKNKKNILRYLFNTNKYNIVEFANGHNWQGRETDSTPWKTYGSLPNPETFNKITDPTRQRAASYGAELIDEAIKTVKPDVYIGIEDIWAFDTLYSKPWWNKINCMIWTTLDSLPILQSAIDAAPKIKNYYVWASFAEKAFQEMGYSHVKTLRGSLDATSFYKMSNLQRAVLRSKNNLQDEFIIGFVFRNQLRKSVPNILDGFKMFKASTPKAKILLHTHWSEGWDIPRLLEEKSINANDILTTYFCKSCSSYSVQPFSGQQKSCPHCHTQQSFSTTNISDGVNESQLNEIYNLMDVYCHPFTSGGQEIPIQEAKLTELITLATDYSCGEDYCHEDSGGLPLDWFEYREPGTQFIKASTCPISISNQLHRVYNMAVFEREELGAKARQFVVDECSIEVIGKKIEDIIDAMPEVEFDFDFKAIEKNHTYSPENLDADNETFLIDLYKNILNEDVDKNSTGLKHWLGVLANGTPKENILKHFQDVALKTNSDSKVIEFGDILDSDDEGRRIAVVVPDSESDVLLVNGLMRNLKKQYPKHNIYIITNPNNFEYIEDNVYIHKCIPYSPSIDSSAILEGQAHHKGYFELAFFPTITTQKIISFVHNGKDKIQFPLV
jgi:glycosyltransferase involved in cell wall biosynthesis